MAEIKATAEGNCDQSDANVNPIIVVKRQWDDWLTASCRLNDIDDLHWSTVSGGVQAIANRPYVHGYVVCDRMIKGAVHHSCRHGDGPHRIKVCIVKKYNKKSWPQIEARIAPRS